MKRSRKRAHDKNKGSHLQSVPPGTWKTSVSFPQGAGGAQGSGSPGSSAGILWSCSSSNLCGCAEQGQPGRSSPLQGEQPLLERRHLLSTGLSTACYPWISTKHGPALVFAASLINTLISALPAAPKNKVDLFLFFQLWLIIKCEP